MSRWGGFRKGRKRYTSDWNQLKSATSLREETVADAPQNFSYVEAQGIWNLRSTIQFPKANALEAITLEYVDYASGTTSTNIPASAIAGDIAIFYASGHGTGISSTDNPTTPNNFIRVRLNVDPADSIIYSAYKILEESDLIATLTSGINESTEYCAVMIFRPSRTPSSLSAFSVNGQATNGDPSPQTIDMSLGPTNKSILAVAFASVTGRETGTTTSPTMIERIVNARSSAYYRIFNYPTVPSNITVDIADEGDNAIQSWGLAIS